jgi:glutamyl-tRNA reductase
VYAVGIAHADIYNCLHKLSSIDLSALQSSSETFTDQDAVRHLFRVAAGLDSLVLGEPQILGQVKDAYRDALAAKTTGIYLDKALHRAFRAAKRVRTETGIGTYPVSVASEAIELAGHIFDDIQKSRVLVIGAGDMACIAARRLKDKGVKEITIINRTYAGACALACELEGTPRPFENMRDELVRADIVITSTGSKDPILGKELMAEVMKHRRGSPIIIIDIAVPRDVEPEVGKLYNCYLYDIDALKAIVDRHYASRQLHMEQAQGIIEYEVEVFDRWLDSLTAQQTIKALYDLMESYTRDQLHAMGLSNNEGERLEQALQTVLKRFLHRPVSFLKNHPGIKHIEYTRRIFQLDEDYKDRHKG